MKRVLLVLVVVTALLLPALSAGAAGPVMPEGSSAAFGMVAASPASADATLVTADLYVDDDYDSNTPGWGTTAFDTIAGAVSAAAAGNSVLVYPGSYAESVTVGKALTLKGFAGTGTFTEPVNVGSREAGVWYVDRYAPGAFDSYSFGGGQVLRHGVRAADQQADSFYNYQGRKLDIDLTGGTQAVSIDMWVDNAWNGAERNAGLWATGYDADATPAAVSAYPILAWRSSATVTPGFYAFDYINGGWTPLKMAAAGDYGKWHTLSVVLRAGTGVEYLVDGASVLNFADADTDTLNNIILNAYNFGADYDVYWDNLLTQSATPAAYLAALVGQIKVDANDVTVAGMAVLDGAQQAATELSGVHVVGGHSNVTVKDSYFARSGVVDGDGSRGIIIENGGVSNLTVQRNYFTGWATGVYLQNADADVLDNVMQDNFVGMSNDGPVNVLVQGNEFLSNDFEGLGIGPEIGTLSVTRNKFAGNLTAMANYDADTSANAEQNWWGSDTGPGPVGPGAGDKVSAQVDFTPWCNEDFSYCDYPAKLNVSANDALFCTGETTTVTIDLAGAVNLYGYQFEVSYDAAKASATGEFVNTFFNAANPAYKPWNADCATTPGVCKFAVSHTSQTTQQAVSGSGPLAKITLTGVEPGAFSMKISKDVLSDVDGTALAHSTGADLPITVCGYATVSGKVTLQGRPNGNVNTGTVVLTEQTPASFGPHAQTVTFSATDGAFTISNVPYLPTGSSYKIEAKHGLYLDNAQTMTVTGNVTGKNTRLWGGDADNSGGIDISDLSCIGGYFGVGSTCGNTGSTDINADGKTNIQDLSIAGGNFNKTAPQAW